MSKRDMAKFILGFIVALLLATTPVQAQVLYRSGGAPAEEVPRCTTPIYTTPTGISIVFRGMLAVSRSADGYVIKDIDHPSQDVFLSVDTRKSVYKKIQRMLTNPQSEDEQKEWATLHEKNSSTLAFQDLESEPPPERAKTLAVIGEIQDFVDGKYSGSASILLKTDSVIKEPTFLSINTQNKCVLQELRFYAHRPIAPPPNPPKVFRIFLTVESGT